MTTGGSIAASVLFFALIAAALERGPEANLRGAVTTLARDGESAWDPGEQRHPEPLAAGALLKRFS